MNLINEKVLREYSLKLVEAFDQGYEICAIGGIVFKFKAGAPDSGKSLMICSDAALCRDWLAKNKIKMERIDAGGSPEWTFNVIE